MSGGFSNTFNVSEATTGTQITFTYLLDASSPLDNDEYADVLISIDGQLFGLNGNDYVERITGGGDSGWQTVTVDVGNLSAGNHEITLGGYLNKKTSSNEDAFIKFSDVKIEGGVEVASDTSDDILNETFTSSDGGFTYSDGGFRGAGSSNYASGVYDSGAGDIAITLGGDDTADDFDMAGAFTKSFTVSDATTDTTVSFQYRFTHADGYESDEYAEVLVEIDGQLYGLNGNDYIDRAYGHGQDNNSSYDSGWVTV
ncbi:unnamed protein product, partial [Laminaria digitata]